MTEAERKATFFALMQTYVDLADDLCGIKSLREFDRISAEMEQTKAEIDAIMAEQNRARLS